MSKIAYVELLDRNNKSIFKHKIRLDKGVGYGDYKLPTSINSDNYKIVAYTKWMLNSKASEIFNENVAIINPFKSNQNLILTTDSIINENKTLNPTVSGVLSLKLKSKEYNKRERVSFSILSNRKKVFKEIILFQLKKLMK